MVGDRARSEEVGGFGFVACAGVEVSGENVRG